MHSTDFEAAERAADRTDTLVHSSSAVSVDDFDYEDRFTPVALRIIPDSQDDGDLEVLTGT